jgi:dTDP-L-rhamnose 4-epimerase
MRGLEQLQQGHWEVRCPVCDSPLKPSLTSEDKPHHGETIYALSKWAEERLALALGKSLGIPTVALRYAVTYGPRQSVYNPYTGVVSIFSTQLLNNQAPVVYEDGHQSRDFLYVGDNASANLFVMTHPETGYQVYNVGTAQPVKVNQLVGSLARLYNKPIEPKLTGNFRPGDVRHFAHDANKLMALGWKPQVSLEQGLANYAKWIESQGPVKAYFSEAEERLKAFRVVVTR